MENSRKYFSQHGEDFLLHQLFDNSKNGFFVEVGCIDGRRFSNTLFFEEMGWKGICVEAHSDYIQWLSENRPSSHIVHAAVGENDAEQVEFFANSRGSLSTLDKTKENEFAANYGAYFSGFEVQKIPMMTLNTIFSKLGVDHIDFLSIDIEGSEVQALKGMDLQRFRPTVMVLESDSKSQKAQMEDILLPAGYHFITSLSENLFYSLHKVHRSIIANKTFKNVCITHTEHPLDHNGDVDSVVDIQTYSNRARKMIDKMGSLFRSIIRGE